MVEEGSWKVAHMERSTEQALTDFCPEYFSKPDRNYYQEYN